MTIVLPPETEALLREKAAREGHEIGAVANSIIMDVLEAEARDRADAVQGVRLGLEDFAAGRYSTSAAAFAEIRARHGLPD